MARVPAGRQISAEFRPSQDNARYGRTRCRRHLNFVGQGENALIETRVFEASFLRLRERIVNGGVIDAQPHFHGARRQFRLAGRFFIDVREERSVSRHLQTRDPTERLLESGVAACKLAGVEVCETLQVLLVVRFVGEQVADDGIKTATA